MNTNLFRPRKLVPRREFGARCHRWLMGTNVRFTGFVMAALLLAFANGAVAAPKRSVAVLYDDSGSMAQTPTRWIGANFSLQVLSALLTEDDELHVANMARPPKINKIDVPSGVDDSLARLQSELKPMNGTPYEGVTALLHILQKSSAHEKWLLIVTDGDFSDFDRNLAREQIDKIVKPLGIRSVFVLIEPTGENRGAKFWKDEAKATVVEVGAARDLPERMEEIAALLTDRDAQGLTLKRVTNELTVTSKFPLRGLVVMYQGDATTHVVSAIAGTKSLAVRRHQIKSVVSNSGIPSGANVAHLSINGGIDSGEEVARVRFSSNIEKSRVKVYPEVAARIDVSVLDRSGKPIDKDNQGFYPVCEGEAATLRTQIVATNGTPLTVGRTDLSQFKVGFEAAPGGTLESTIGSGQDHFSINLTPKSETRLNPYARYPGYFNFQSQTLNLRPVACKRKVVIALLTPLNGDGLWSAPVNRLSEAAALRFAATIDGRAATEEDLSKWTWKNNASEKWSLQTVGTELVLRPKSGCCALTWSRPKATQGLLQLTQLETGNTRDIVTMPPPVGYNFTLPTGLFERLWWLYGCPLTVFVGMLILAWYLWRLIIVKERFGARAVVHIHVRNIKRREPLCRSSNFISRWFWPSRREIKTIEGLRFMAVRRGGSSVLVDGRTLTKHHEVDDWQFDEYRFEKRLPQLNAKLGHQSNIVRRPPNGRPDQFDVRLQYNKDGSKANWPD